MGWSGVIDMARSSVDPLQYAIMRYMLLSEHRKGIALAEITTVMFSTGEVDQKQAFCPERVWFCFEML